MDTASSTLAFALHTLSQHTLSYQRAQSEARTLLRHKPIATWTSADLQQLPYITACIKEVLRLYPAAPFTGRIALRDTAINGQAIAEGEQCFMDFKSMHMHEDFWPCAEVR